MQVVVPVHDRQLRALSLRNHCSQSCVPAMMIRQYIPLPGMPLKPIFDQKQDDRHAAQRAAEVGGS